jgi:hypothetical protein
MPVKEKAVETVRSNFNPIWVIPPSEHAARHSLFLPVIPAKEPVSYLPGIWKNPTRYAKNRPLSAHVIPAKAGNQLAFPTFLQNFAALIDCHTVSKAGIRKSRSNPLDACFRRHDDGLFPESLHSGGTLTSPSLNRSFAWP